MKTTIAFLTLLASFSLSFCQTVTGKELLEKTIAHHDPNNAWDTFNATFMVTMKSPNKPVRDSKITINLPQQYFQVTAKRDTLTTQYIIHKQECSITLNGINNLDKHTLKTHNLSCERGKMYKDYYTYLYGLPMKLKDPGTIIHDKVRRKSFKGKEYLVLKVTYDESVGSDVWYFYFNPKTYAMEVYQFFKTDKNGTIKANSGEYILLSGTETINTIKMPKNRAWYYNKDDGYLGTDILKN